MKIIRDEEFTKYVCSICGHEHIIKSNLTTIGEPFTPYERKIRTYEPWDEDTPCGRMEMPHLVEYDGYICPKCGKVQISDEDAKRIHTPELIAELKRLRGVTT